jgi:hypothetical protein
LPRQARDKHGESSNEGRFLLRFKEKQRQRLGEAVVEGTAQDGSPSVLIFPEGVLTSGRSAADCPFPLRIVSLTPGCSSPTTTHAYTRIINIPDESDETDKRPPAAFINVIMYNIYFNDT